MSGQLYSDAYELMVVQMRISNSSLFLIFINLSKFELHKRLIFIQ